MDTLIKTIVFADMELEAEKAAQWAAEQIKANERASALYVRALEAEADYFDLVMTQEWALY